MKNTLTTHEAAQILSNDENANWSCPGAFALVEYLEELETELETEIELDYVAIRCDYSEFASLHDWITEYYGEELTEAMKSAGIDVEDGDDIDELIRDHIHDHGTLVEFGSGIIVSSF